MTPDASEVIRLGERPEPTLRFIGLLRDRLSEGVITQWRGELVDTMDVTALHHLPPPTGVGSRIDEWQATFRVGLCYFRKGPAFIQIKDVRNAEASANFILDDPALIIAFTHYLQPRSLTGLESTERDATDTLLAEGLLLRVGDHATTLPYRMSRWPVPATLV
ncbi:DUF5825 family protein [Micromonospora sp. CPCC 206061]|uniref:DUF5825 family protein n=1 Tax=Micromonospora sp. CPCC 206061 TaxID=3122410 RepID=UPI002FF1E869